MTQFFKRTSLPFFRPAFPGLSELTHLLDLFPSPVLLVDHQEGDVVLAGNLKALQMSAYTRAEMEQTPLKQFFPDINNIYAQQKDDPITARLQVRNGLSENVVVRTQTLDPQGHWRIIFFEPEGIFRQKLSSDHRMRTHMSVLIAVSQAIQSSNADEVYSTYLQAASLLSGASAIALYRVDGSEPMLNQIKRFGEPLPLPLHIPATEIGRNPRPDLWIQGKRIRSGLQRLARSQQFSYMATAGIGDEQALLGVLIAADRDGVPDDNLLPVMQIFSGLLTGFYQKDILVKELRTSNLSLSEQISIQDVVQETVQDGVVTLDTSMKIQGMNPAAEIMLGYVLHEVRNQPIENVLIGTVNIAGSLQLALEGIPTSGLGNTILHRRDGRAFQAHIQIMPATHQGEIRRILVFLHDQSEHQQIAARTQQLEQRALLGEVTAIFAHEVRNPINNISMGLQILEMNLPEMDANRKHIDLMKNDIDRLLHLMESVLTFSRTAEMHLVPVHPGILFDRMLQRWKPRFAQSNVTPVFHISADTPQIMGDDKSLEQVFTNLFTNAVRAMKGGGTLTVRAQPTAAENGQLSVKIDVSDTGTGIPPENLAVIFDPFFTTDPHGTGLGLAITQRIILAHKGNITVESFPGGGTVFHLHIPALLPNIETPPA